MFHQLESETKLITVAFVQINGVGAPFGRAFKANSSSNEL